MSADNADTEQTTEMLTARIAELEHLLAAKRRQDANPYCWLVYDIPDVAKIANPSPQLRRIASRVNLSCWVIPEANVPYSLLHEMAEHGVDWHVVRFDPDEKEKLVGMVAATLTKSLRDIPKRAGLAEANADSACRGASGADRWEALGKYERRTRAILKRAEGLMDDYKEAARHFGLDFCQLGSGAARDAVQGIKAAVEARAALYAELRWRLNERPQDQGMAAAMAADDVPVGVALDYAEEQGIDVAAARAAFQGVM